MADVVPGGSPDQDDRYSAASPGAAQNAGFGPDATNAPTTPFDPPPAPKWPATDFSAPAPPPPVTEPIIAPPADVSSPEPGGDQVPPVKKRRSPRWLPIALVVGFIAACAIAMLLILGFSYGISALIVGLVAAILPVPVLVGCFLWLDRYEPEPTRYLLFCFAWGSSVATLTALGVNSLGSYVFDRLGLPDALVAVLVAPFIEESMKAAGPILLLWRRRREWSGITDGIVYCGLSAVGFAMVENVLYLGGHGYAAGADQYGPATGIQNVFLIFIVRILFTGFAHPLFTSMSGIGLGVSSRSADRRVIWLAPIAGLLTAMILHGTFNLLPTLSAAIGQPLIMLYGYLGFMVPLFFVAVGFAIALRGWEGRLSERILPYYVRTGWFSPPEIAALGSLGRRHSARRWAKRVSGDAGVKAMRGFQYAATQLALLRDGMQRGLNRKPQDVQRAADDERRLLTAIVGYRSVFAGRDPQMPRAFWDGQRYQIAFPDGVTRAVDAPDEPVVPVPVRLAPQMVGAWAGGGYGAPPAWGQPPSGYGQPPGYGQASGYGQATGYAAPPGYGPPPGYGAPSGYGSSPAYGPPPGYGAPPFSGYGNQTYPGVGYSAPPAPQTLEGYGPPPATPTSGGYGAPPATPTSGGYGAPTATPTSGGYGAPPATPTSGGYGAPPATPAPEGYSAPPAYQPEYPTNGSQQGYAGQPGYPSQSGYAGQSDYPGQPGYAGQPGQPGYAGHPGQPGYAGQPDYPGQPGYAGYAGEPGQPGYANHAAEASAGYPPQPSSPEQTVQPGQAPNPWAAPGRAGSSNKDDTEDQRPPAP